MEVNAERWHRVEEQIRTLSAKDDLELIKARFCASIGAVRAEAAQERQKVNDLFTGLIGKLDSSSLASYQSTNASYTPDGLTGLPARGFAETELNRLHTEPEDQFLALFIVKRLALINAKFGYSRGDQVLLKVVTQLAQSLPDFHSLYRWAPCAFLAVAPPKFTFKDVRSKVHVVEITRMTPVLEWEGRSAMVPVSLDCRILSIRDFETPSDLFLRLDTLAADA